MERDGGEISISIGANTAGAFVAYPAGHPAHNVAAAVLAAKLRDALRASGYSLSTEEG